MFFAHLRKIKLMPDASRIRKGLWCVCAGAAIGLSAPSIVSADELVDEIKFENKSAVSTGVVISTPGSSPAVSSAPSQTTGSQSANQPDLTVTEYDRGGRTVREYRSGGRLMYVETSKDGEFSYVFDHSERDNQKESRVRAGFIISNW